ncbi:MAG TPA: DUF58 domain-containing protein [Gaiellaceae bacterium]
MTNRGRLALALGAATYVAAWAFGSRPLYPVATGLLIAVAVAALWVSLAEKPMRLGRHLRGGDHFEGDDLRIDLDLDVDGAIPPPSIVLVEDLGRLGNQRTPMRPNGRRLHAHYYLRSVPRGRYPYRFARAVLEDPFGLQRAEVDVGAGGALLVYPRLVDLDRIFSDAGAQTPDGRKLLLRRPTGFELHSVREYEQGESLRKVHWRSTAKRGQLMVKELEDAPRDEVAVVLDADASSVAGTPPDSSFDMQVRAAGSILRAHVLRGRRSVLVVSSALAESRRIHSSDGDWRAALELLAAVEPTASVPLATLLAADESPAARALELTVVTARLSPELVDRLVRRSLGRRGAALIYVDAPSFARSGKARPEPTLLRLQAAGVPVAVLRRGDDLAAALGGALRAGAASG